MGEGHEKDGLGIIFIFFSLLTTKVLVPFKGQHNGLPLFRHKGNLWPVGSAFLYMYIDYVLYSCFI